MKAPYKLKHKSFLIEYESFKGKVKIINNNHKLKHEGLIWAYACKIYGTKYRNTK